MSRADNRAQNIAAILDAARDQIAVHGGGGLSMRAVARDVGLVSSAIYRYFPTREALLTAMIVESYGHLAEALESGVRGRRTPRTRWLALARSMRNWAVTNPHEFQLIYGTPVPGYVAPPETVPAAEAVARPFLAVGAGHDVVGFTEHRLVAQMAARQPTAAATSPSGVAATLAELATLVGFVGLEIAGHFVGSADPADPLFEAVLRRQVQTLGLT